MNEQQFDNILPEFKADSDWNKHSRTLEKYFKSNGIYDDKRKISVLIATIDQKVHQKLQELCKPVLPFFKTYADLRVIMEQHYSSKVSNFKKQKKAHSPQKLSKEKLCEIQKLPDDCLNYIFKILSIADRLNVEKVCKSWKDVAKQSWNHLKELKINPKFLGLKPIGRKALPWQSRYLKYPIINEWMIERLLKRCGKYLKKIDAEFPKFDCVLSLVAEYCPNIEIIQCSTASLVGVHKLSETCKNISEISIQSSVSYEFNLADLFFNNKKLQVVNIPKYNASGKCLSKLPFEEIISINIGKVYEPSVLVQVIERSRKLIRFGNDVTDTKVIKAIIENCTTLTELHLNSSIILESNLIQIFLNNRNLQSLKLESFKSLTGECLVSLNNNVVEKIMLTGTPNLQRDHLINSLPHLEKLHTLEFENFSGDSFDNVVESISLCQNLKNLFIINVENLKNFVLFDSPKNIEKLCVYIKSPLTDGFLRYMSRNLLDLKYLDLKGCEGITDDALYSICNLLSKLEVLKINDNKNLVGSGFFLASNLKELTCRRCSSVQDESLIKLLRRAKNLELLDIGGCTQITNATIKVAIEVLNHRISDIELEIQIDHTNINALQIKESSPLLNLLKL